MKLWKLIPKKRKEISPEENGSSGYKHELRKCPAYGQTCRMCTKKNHFAKMCKNSRKKSRMW